MFNDVLVLRKEAQAQKPKHIRVEIQDTDHWDNYIPVQVNYRLPSGKKRLMSARYIQELKMLGVLPK